MLVLLGTGLIVVGFLYDQAFDPGEHGPLRSILPLLLVSFVFTAANIIGEETSEAMGVGLVFLSVLIHFRS